MIIVSNRLPVSVKKESGELAFFPSIGGLATGLSSYADDKRNKWIGWPGIPSDDLTERERRTIETELAKHNCYPVFLTKKQIDEFYNGYSNSLLWPLFHDREPSADALQHEERLWHAYERVNKLFADVVLALSDTGDTVWVHDYQLLLLPALLRLERPYDKIGFFLHIPFPRPEHLAKLAAHEALVAGVLGASLIGLHIELYVHNFLDTVHDYDIALATGNKIILQDRVIRVTDFPMGIDYAKYEKARKSRAVGREYTKLLLQYVGLKVILTVDRLDPSKGLVERARAYQALLRGNPQLHGKVVMIMLVVPSRTDIPEYQQLKQELDAVIAETNDEFGMMPWIPIDYQYAALPFEQVTALYRRADVAFIAPLRDGMNLVAKEYLASKPYQRGVLVLSKTAGAASQLKGAVMVDPTRPATLVKGLVRALEMRPDELKKRVRRMQKQLAKSNVQAWAQSFTKSLRQDARVANSRTATLTNHKAWQLIDAFQSADRRLLLLDYDGVLERFHDRPERAVPDERLLKLLERLKRRCNIVIISGRSRQNMEEWFGKSPVDLVAEHGAFTRLRSAGRWHTTPNNAQVGWQDLMLPILERYTRKTPGSAVEIKESSLVWHYRRASTYYAQKYLVTLRRLLVPLGKKYGVEVRQGNKILELRPSDINKGTAAVNWMEKMLPEFVMAIGDDYTDEDMFARLPANAYTVKVGWGRTVARYRLKNSVAVLELLEKLAD